MYKVDPDDNKYYAQYVKGKDFDAMNRGFLDVSALDIAIDIPEIDKYPNEAYALSRKFGLGTSDSSVVLGVNPYSSEEELIAEKCRDYLTAEEMEIGNKSSVRKGRELEPMIITKFSEVMNTRIIKPVDMFVHKQYPWMKFNFDGVMEKAFKQDGSYQYIPNEIKVMTTFGRKHYALEKAWFKETVGFTDHVLNPFNAGTINTITTKAASYGIPPYYYTQLQQQIFGLNAPFGYLTIMDERDWLLYSWMVWRDEDTIRSLLMRGQEVWTQIQQLRPIGFEANLQVKIARILAAA